MIKNAKIVTKDANPAQYHAQEAKRGEAGFIMSNGALTNFASCPARFRAGYNPPDSDAKFWGSLLDCRFLTPRQFDDRYVVQPLEYTNDKGETKPWNNNATVCKEWRAEQGDAEIVKQEALDEVEDAVARMMADPVIAAFHKDSDTQVWLAGEWHDEPTGLVVPVRGLVDLAPRAESEFALCLADLKTTRSAAVLPWQRWCYQARYHWQAALYIALWNAATGEERNTFCFIVQENFAPWQTGKRMLSQDFLTLGTSEYRAALANYCQCLKHNRWPGYDDTDEAIQSWSLVQPEPFMAERAQFAPRYDFEAPDAPDAPDAAYDQDIPH